MVTTIQISDENWKELTTNRKNPKETINQVLSRIILKYKEVTKNEKSN